MTGGETQHVVPMCDSDSQVL